MLLYYYIWETDAVVGQDVMNNTPLWLNQTLKLPIKSDWLNQGINTIADYLGPMRNVIPMNEFMENLNVKTNFLKYNSITTEI